MKNNLEWVANYYAILFVIAIIFLLAHFIMQCFKNDK